MKSLGRGSEELPERSVPVLVRRLPRAWRLGCHPDGTGRKPA